MGNISLSVCPITYKMESELYSGDLPTFYEYHPISGDDPIEIFVRSINILFNLAKIIKSISICETDSTGQCNPSVPSWCS